MPELPEVETYVRELAPLLFGRTVLVAQVFWPRTIAAPSPAQFVRRMAGQQFARFGRRGKYMLLGMRQGATLIVHLRMTGRLQVEPGAALPDKHTQVLFDLDDGQRLCTAMPASLGGSGSWIMWSRCWANWDPSHSKVKATRRPWPHGWQAARRHQGAAAGPDAGGRRRQHLRRRGALSGWHPPRREQAAA